MSNKTSNGNAFGNAEILQVWNKGRIVPGYAPDQYRKDACGAWISFADYGNTNEKMGWEVDHIIPVSRGGSDRLSNLQPLQWENNRHKGNTYPHWSCAVPAA